MAPRRPNGPPLIVTSRLSAYSHRTRDRWTVGAAEHGQLFQTRQFADRYVRRPRSWHPPCVALYALLRGVSSLNLAAPRARPFYARRPRGVRGCRNVICPTCRYNDPPGFIQNGAGLSPAPTARRNGGALLPWAADQRHGPGRPGGASCRAFSDRAPNARGSVVPFTPAGNARGYITLRRID